MLHEFEHNSGLVLDYNNLDYSSKSKQAKQLDLHIYLDSQTNIWGCLVEIISNNWVSSNVTQPSLVLILSVTKAIYTYILTWHVIR